MERERADGSREEYLFQQRCLHYRGTAKINLRHLKILNDNKLPINEKNIDRLLSIYKRAKPKRLEIENFVPALIAEPVLEQSLADSGTSRAQLLISNEVPDLILPEHTELKVLHGRHRLLAASRFLDGQLGRWWIVELYDDRLPQECVTHLTELYSNSQNSCDGDIYRQYRQNQLNLDSTAAEKWSVRLSQAKLKDIKQLQEKEGDICLALDRLLPYRGLWARVQLGMLHRVLPIHCSPEVTSYLRTVADVWDHITGQDSALQEAVDPYTVSQLEALTPGLSLDDRDRVRNGMSDQTLFTATVDVQIRTGILARLESLKKPILSLYTFFEDVKLLELGMKPLRSLLPGNPRSNVPLRSRFAQIHETLADSTSISVQRSEFDHDEWNCRSENFLGMAMCQLFLLATRHFVALNGVAPRKEKGKNKPVTQESYERALRLLADLAHRMGFRSEPIRLIQQRQPDHEMAITFLRQLLPEEEYDYDPAARYELAASICERISVASQSRRSTLQPSYFSDHYRVPKCHRYGRPYEDDHKVHRKHLFLPNICHEPHEHLNQHLSSLAIKRFAVLAFFGRWLPDRDGSTGGDDDGRPPAATVTGPSRMPSASASLPDEHRGALGESATAQTGTHEDIEASGTPEQDGDYKQLDGPNALESFLMGRLQAVSNTSMALIMGAESSYTCFSLENGRAMFTETVCNLANEGYCFWILEGQSEVSTKPVHDLWDSAQEHKTVIAAQKHSSQDAAPIVYSGRSLAGLLTSLEHILQHHRRQS